MNINSSSPQGPRQPNDPATLEAARAQEAQKQAPSKQSKPVAQEQQGAGSDSVQVSSDAKALAEQRDARGANSSLSADRLKEIGERLASGFYDSPEVIDQVARKVARDPDFLG